LIFSHGALIKIARIKLVATTDLRREQWVGLLEQHILTYIPESSRTIIPKTWLFTTNLSRALWSVVVVIVHSAVLPRPARYSLISVERRTIIAKHVRIVPNAIGRATLAACQGTGGARLAGQ
jgi:hypothetical protein